MNFVDWGNIEYEKALAQQLTLVEQVIRDPEQESLVFCSHPPVVTLGRKSLHEDILNWSGPVIPVQRGGRATYHGPGQIVVYPILYLNWRNRDLYQFLRNLEDAVIESLKIFGIKGEGAHAPEDGKSDSRSPTGVWVQGKKLVSIGIAVKRWVSYHGLAINLDKDPLAFTGIAPCGYTSETMVSLEELLGKRISRLEFQHQLRENLYKKLNYKSV